MQQIHSLVKYLDGIVWGPVMLFLIVGTGVWLSITLGFIQFRKLPAALKLIFSSRKGKAKLEKGEITPFQALTTALAATIGTGNIAGVATAIAVGGPGAIFWMWVSAIFGMATKYSEAALAVHFRKRLPDGTTIGGPMEYISQGLGLKWLGMLFAIFGAVAAFGIGSMVQSNSVASAMKQSFHVPMAVSGIVLTILTGLVIIGGIKRIGQVTEKLVPFMAVFYFIVVLIVIFANIEKLPGVIGMIFSQAFSPTAASGGFAGAVVMMSIRYGIARGVFSNEAGLGSAPIAHAAARTDNAVRQGLIGMTGVFFDTIIICSLTAFAILTSGVWNSGDTGAVLTSSAFASVLGQAGHWFLAIGLMTFAYSTILGWSYYGEQCTEFIFGVKARFYYKILYCISVMMGTVWKLGFVWDLSDLFNGLMAIPNLIGLLGLSLFLKKLTQEKMPTI